MPLVAPFALALWALASAALGSTPVATYGVERARMLQVSASPTPVAASPSSGSVSANASATVTASATYSPTASATATLSPGASASVSPTTTPSMSSSPSPSVSPGTIFSRQGCACMGQCMKTFDSVQEWCFTSEQGVEPPPATNVLIFVPGAKPSPGATQVEEPPCGFYSSTRQAYWDYACTNTTAAPRQLTTATGVWTTITWSAIVTTIVVYAPLGAWAAYSVGTGLRAPVAGLLVWLGLVLFGTATAAIVAVALTYPLAQIYLAMPYAISFDAAIALGISLGVMTAYAQMGQHVEAVRPSGRAT